MPSFKINNWDIAVKKKRLSVSIKAVNYTNNAYYGKRVTNKDVSEGGFKLIDNIDDLYAFLEEGAKPCPEDVKLNFSDDGHLTISQTVKQADKNKVFNSDIALDKRELKAKQHETKEPEETHPKKEKQSAKDHQALFDKIAELENEIKGLKSGYGNDLADIKKLIAGQTDRIKALEDENASLKKNFDEYKAKKDNEISQMKSDYEKQLEQNKNTIAEQAKKIKAIEDENYALKKDLGKSEDMRPSGTFYFLSSSDFDLSNGCKRAVSKTSAYHTIFSSTNVSKNTWYSLKIVGDYYVNIGLIPENMAKNDNNCYNNGTFAYACDGTVFPAGNYPVSKFKDGDTVSVYVSDSQICWNLNNQRMYTCDLHYALPNFQLYLYTNCTQGVGAELL